MVWLRNTHSKQSGRAAASFIVLENDGSIVTPGQNGIGVVAKSIGGGGPIVGGQLLGGCGSESTRCHVGTYIGD